MQESRGMLEKASRAHKIVLITAKEGLDTAQRVFNPELLHAGVKEVSTHKVSSCRNFSSSTGVIIILSL